MVISQPLSIPCWIWGERVRLKSLWSRDMRIKLRLMRVMFDMSASSASMGLTRADLGRIRQHEPLSLPDVLSSCQKPVSCRIWLTQVYGGFYRHTGKDKSENTGKGECKHVDVVETEQPQPSETASVHFKRGPMDHGRDTQFPCHPQRLSTHVSRTKDTVTRSWNPHGKWSKITTPRRTTGDIQTSKKDEKSEYFSTRVQCRNQFCLLAVSLSRCWSDLRADTGTLFFPDKTQTKRSHTQSHKEESLFFVKGSMIAPLTTAGVSDEVAQEIQMPVNDTVREYLMTEIQKRDSSIGGTRPRSPPWSECQPTYVVMGNRPLVGTRYHWVMSIWSAQQLESWGAEQYASFKNQQGGCRQHWMPCSSHHGLHIWIFPADLVYRDQRTTNQLRRNVA